LEGLIMHKMYWAKHQNTIVMCTYDVLLLQRSNTAETEFNNTDSVHITYRYGALVQPLVQWKAIIIINSVCVCACVRARARACVCVCV
jgi:hypothetical protein